VTVLGCVVADSNDLAGLAVIDGSVAMAREKARNDLRWDDTRDGRTPRFRLKTTSHCSGQVDGAWWPRSDDLMTELPDLIAVLSARQGAISRVIYNPSEWTTAPTELVTRERAVQLDRSCGQPPNTVEVLDGKGTKVVLLVVPAHIDPDQAHAIVMAAVAPGNASSVDALLMISVKDRESRAKRDAARERWDSQGRAKQQKRQDRPSTPGQFLPASFPYRSAPPDHN
jgi:Family of unknown function (DUF5994)